MEWAAPYTAIAQDVWTDVYTAEFGLSCLVSGIIGATVYLALGYIFHSLYPRSVKRDVYSLKNLRGDVSLALQSVLFGSLVLGSFELLRHKYGISLAYSNIDKYGYVYWLISIPAYLLVWDFVFYSLHHVLHMESVYELSHCNHHAFRPPTAWSGIAVDNVETILSGLAPFLIPLWVFPMHMYTAFALNVALEGWATMLHSSCPWKGNWLFVGAIDHNVHHEKGRFNGNYGAIFTLWDRMFGTLLRDTPDEKMPYWLKEERAVREAAAAGVKVAQGPKAAASPAARRGSVSGRRGSVSGASAKKSTPRGKKAQ